MLSDRKLQLNFTLIKIVDLLHFDTKIKLLPRLTKSLFFISGRHKRADKINV